MQTAEEARNETIAVLTGLTYIDELISGATVQGLYKINVAHDKLTIGMIDELKTNGYAVYVSYAEGNENFPLYAIDWSI